MSVTLLIPYAGQAALTIYTGQDEYKLLSLGDAVRDLTVASNYGAYMQAQAGAAYLAANPALPAALANPASGLPSALAGLGVGPSGAVVAPAPFSVIATAGAGSGTIDVQWRHRQPLSVTSFIVTPSSGASVTVAANGRTVQSLQLTGMPNGTAQTVKVQAMIGGLTSLISTSNSVTPTATPSSILPVSRALEFWWSARQIASPPADSALMNQLLDVSGNGYTATGRATTAVAGTVPTWKANASNSKPAVNFVGGGDRFDIASALVPGLRASKATLFASLSVTANPNQSGKTTGRVLSNEVTGNGALPVPNYGIDTATGLARTNNRFGLTVGDTAGQVNPSTYYRSTTRVVGSTVALNTPFTVIVTAPGKIFVNGVAVTSAIPVDAVEYDSSVNPLANWSIGSEIGANGNNSAAINLFELGIAADIYTDAECAALHAYLAGGY